MSATQLSVTRRTLPHDLQRHITTKYLNKEERRSYGIGILYGEALKNDLKALPESVRVKLFVNGIYNKCLPLIGCDENVIQTGINGRSDRLRSVNTIGPISQYLQTWLDTIYYGFTTSDDVRDKTPYLRPVYAMNVRVPGKLTYVPTKGHCELTDRISVNDFVRFISMFIQLGDPLVPGQCKHKMVKLSVDRINRARSSNKWLIQRDNILYDFSVIVRFLANKYRRIARETELNATILKEQMVIAREQAKLAKVAKREQAKLAKVAEREQAKLAKVAEREQAKLAKVAEREQAKLVKDAKREQAKLAKVAEREQAKLAKVAEREQAKLAKVAEREHAKTQKK